MLWFKLIHVGERDTKHVVFCVLKILTNRDYQQMEEIGYWNLYI